MKVQERVRDVQSTGAFATSKFSSVQNATFYEVMSDTIYTNKVRAVLRELSCNARDAHDDADCLDKKFKVQLPTSLDMTCAVRDFGKGLDDHEVRGRKICGKCGHTDVPNSAVSFCHICESELELEPGIFNTYFLSTKRESETATGCLGLGTKSPFALSDTFKVESFYGGRHRTYKCYMNSQNEPDIALLTDVETDEPTGLRVSLNVDESQLYKFETEAINVFEYFDNPPEINKQSVYQQIEHRQARYIINGDGYHFTGKTGQTYAVMGNVAYEIPSDYIYLEGYIEFPLADENGVGTLKFNPGREYLSIDEKTEANLNNRITQVRRDLAYDMFNTIRNIDSKFERAVKLDQMKVGIFGELDGENKKRLNFFELPILRDNPFVVFDSGTKYNHEACPVSSLSNIRFFKVGENKSVRGYTMRLREWTNQSYRNKAVLMSPSQIKDTEIPESYLEDLDSLPEVSRDTSYVRNTERIFEFGFKGWGYNYGRDRNQNWTAVDVDIEDGEQRIYVEISHYEPKIRFDNRSLSEYITKIQKLIGEEVTVYGVKSSLVKQKKFQDSDFIEFSEWARKKIEENIPSVYYVQNGSTDCNVLFTKLASNLNDDLFTEFSTYRDMIAKQPSRSLLRDVNCDVEEDDTIDSLYKEILSKYPLLAHLRSAEANLDDIIEYIGAMNVKVSQ